MPNHRNQARDEAIARGDKWYESGEPCKHGHVAPRMVSCHKCRDCDRMRKAHRQENDATYRQRARERGAAWREANPEQALAGSRDWYANNKERASANTVAWQRRNRDAVNRIRRGVYARNPRYLAYAKARLKRVKQATPKWADIAAIIKFYEDCPEGHQVDHIIPLKGEIVSGLHVLENLQYLTVSENSKKWNHYTPDWMTTAQQ